MLLRFDPFRELDRAFDDVWRTSAGARSPIIPMDAVRHGDRVFISFDLPGVDPERVDLTVERNVLTVTAERAASVQEATRSSPTSARRGRSAVVCSSVRRSTRASSRPPTTTASSR
jgi:HSP20 family protein